MLKNTTFAIFLLLSLAIVGAVDTPIKVKTLPNDKVAIFVLDADQVYYLLESYHKAPDANGWVSVVYSLDTSQTLI